MKALTEQDLLQINALVARHPVEVSLGNEAYAGLTLHGTFEGYADYFTLHFREVEFVTCPGGFEPKSFRSMDFGLLCHSESKWRALKGLYSGRALVAEADALGEAGPFNPPYLLVAGQIYFEAGSDWILSDT